MLSPAERRANRKALETKSRVRVENLRKLAQMAGSLSNLAKLLGINVAILDQIAGPKSLRTLEDSMARDIEFALDLQRGYLDQPHKLPKG